MSWTILPDQLIAHVSCYLKYSDICNLVETSQKNFDVMKGYKKDKLKPETLNYNRHETITATDSSNKQFLFRNLYEIQEDSDKLKQALQKCCSIKLFRIHGPLTFSESFNVLMKTKTKISTLQIQSYQNVTIERMLEISQKISLVFTEVVHSDWLYDGAAILNDEFLTKILPGSTIRKRNHRIFGDVFSPLPITDRTLKALIGKSELQSSFFIIRVHNSITIKALVAAIQILDERELIGPVEWDLGILPPSQAAKAERYFGVNGKLRDICKVHVDTQLDEVTYYKVSSLVGGKFCIEFEVAHPWYF